MLLSEIFEQLTYGELSNVNIGGGEAGEISVDNYARIVAHINLGLTDLHTRFPMRYEEIRVQQYSAIELYRLHSDFAVSNTASTEPTKYLVDSTASPFQDNVIAIDQVFDEEGKELFLNNEDEDKSLYTPMYDVLQIPDPVATNASAVIFRASHPKIKVIEGFDPTSVDVRIPIAALQALLFFVASRVISPTGQDGMIEGNNYLGKYNEAVNLLTNNAIFLSNLQDNKRLGDAGWV